MTFDESEIYFLYLNRLNEKIKVTSYVSLIVLVGLTFIQKFITILIDFHILFFVIDKIIDFMKFKLTA